MRGRPPEETTLAFSYVRRIGGGEGELVDQTGIEPVTS